MSFLDTVTTKLGNFIGLNTNNLPQPSEGFSINEFTSNINKRPLARNNLFLVRITPKGSSSNLKDLTFLTDSFRLPGIAVATSDTIRRQGTGVTKKYPYNAIFTDVNATFLVDSTAYTLTTFHAWMNRSVVFDPKQVGVGAGNDLNSAVSNAESLTEDDAYEVNYSSDYLCTIEVVLYNEASKKWYGVKLKNAFPIFVGDVSLSWADNDSIMRLPVTFTYTDWEWMPEAYEAAVAIDQKLSTLQKVLKVGTIVQTVMSTKRPDNLGDIINVVNNANVVRSGSGGIF